MKNDKGGHVRRTGKRVLEFVAVQRRDCKQWAIPGVRTSYVYVSLNQAYARLDLIRSHFSYVSYSGLRMSCSYVLPSLTLAYLILLLTSYTYALLIVAFLIFLLRTFRSCLLHAIAYFLQLRTSY